jgi:flagellum-specific peptidoglycan hydrolase FlgJ
MGRALPKCNCFGIKAYVGAYGTQDLMTTEYVKGQARTMWQKFATFATVYDCFEKHAELITCNRRYAEPSTSTRMIRISPSWYMVSPRFTPLTRNTQLKYYR